MKDLLNILMKNKKVNSYTKMIILLTRLEYHKDYYIPNRKLMNILGINKNRVIVILHQLEEDKIIKISYKGRKRYFKFLNIAEEKEKKEEDVIPVDLFDYNWLEENEE